MINKWIMKSVAVFGIACLVCVAANAATINWQPVNGDRNGDFGDPSHWDSGTVPGSGDDVTFPASSPREAESMRKIAAQVAEKP